MKNWTLARKVKKQMNKYGKLRKPIVSYMISVIIIVLHTKFVASSFHSFWEIFDEISFYNGTSRERKKNEWTN